MRPRTATLVATVCVALVACGPAPDRVNPERYRLTTDDLARSVLEATGDALRLPTSELRGVADARRCEDRTTARHQVDSTFDAAVGNTAATTDSLVRALRAEGLDTTLADSDDGRVVSGSNGPSTYEVVIGPSEQTVSVRSSCLEVGKLQAVEISFAERYSVRPGEESPDR
ncbi:hypothetical protein ACHAAC_07860 [Aeromicrobium sp. CF4.19]|uniref:hypothetical protein n=1 Tax=Aeromicrobium sp. CF4.19 TaxID=3373082 RepID=UPI003EE46E28